MTPAIVRALKEIAKLNEAERIYLVAVLTGKEAPPVPIQLPPLEELPDVNGPPPLAQPRNRERDRNIAEMHEGGLTLGQVANRLTISHEAARKAYRRHRQHVEEEERKRQEAERLRVYLAAFHHQLTYQMGHTAAEQFIQQFAELLSRSE